MNARHKLVKGAIGGFPEEEYAYWLVNTLSWILPLMIGFGAIVDVLLIYIYMRFAHPWKNILFYKDETSKMEENFVVDESRVTQEGEEKVCPEIIPTSHTDPVCEFFSKNYLMAKLLQNNSNLNDLEYSRHLKVRKIEKKAKNFFEGQTKARGRKTQIFIFFGLFNIIWK